MRWKASVLIAVGGLALPISAAFFSGCGGDETPKTAPKPAPEPEAPEPADRTIAGPQGAVPTLVITQARFDKVGGKIKPRPATLWIWRQGADGWHKSLIEDQESNVFHKGMIWNDGILTIGAMKARLVHWTRSGDELEPKLMWEQSWGGRFDRLRDIEIGDVTGDGKDDLVIATHDQGVVAVGIAKDDGFDFVEMDQTPDTFVHEIEIGDVDGDGKNEFYATPSDRNKSSGVSQKGGVVRYDWNGETFERSKVVHWDESHAKEILVTDLDGDGTDELYAVREGHVVKNDAGKKERLEPVRIARMEKNGDVWTENVLATLDDDMCRFLLAADANHDGKTDLIAAGRKSGLWLLEPKDGKLATTSIATDSSGFEHAIHAADLDGDGQVELYVASDEQGELRRYVWDGSRFAKEVLGTIPERTLTWSIQDGKF